MCLCILFYWDVGSQLSLYFSGLDAAGVVAVYGSILTETDIFMIFRCAQCDKIAPAFDDAADMLISDKPPVFLAEVRCCKLLCTMLLMKLEFQS